MVVHFFCTDDVREAMVEKGSYDFVMKAMREFPKDPEIQRTGCLALEKLSKRGKKPIIIYYHSYMYTIPVVHVQLNSRLFDKPYLLLSSQGSPFSKVEVYAVHVYLLSFLSV